MSWDHDRQEELELNKFEHVLESVIDVLGLVWLVFLFGQILESIFLTPVLIGDKIGLHPVMVIFSLMAGGVIAGFVGLLVAIPIASIVMVFLRHLILEYLQSDFYQN